LLLAARHGHAEHADLRSAHHGQDRVTGGNRPADDRRRPGQELGQAAIQERLVPVSARSFAMLLG
jgi:hypothetical protein